MKAFLFFFIFLASHWGISQNRVVKDNLACLYGIKNPDGAWVVKPKYILLTGYTCGYFVTQEGPNYGLIAQDGTELLPCEYTRIKPLNSTWKPVGLGQPANRASNSSASILFQVEKNSQRSLIDSNGKTLLPLTTQFFRKDGENVIITEYRSPNHFTSYIDSEGNYLFKDLPGAIEPFRSEQIALIGLRTPGSNGTVEGNVRVINKKGEYLNSRQFSRGRICAKGLIVFEDSLGRVGTMDATGRTIISPQYKLISSSYSRENILPCLYNSQHTFIIENDEGKFGLMNGKGRVICAPSYDHLEKLHGQWKTAHTSWRVRQTGKLGMLKADGSVAIPCSYDTLIPFKLNYGRNNDLDGFIVSNSGKFGLIKTQGDTIIPLEHTFFQHASRTRSVLFGNTKQLSEITLLDGALNIAPIEKLVELTDYSVFIGKEGDYFVLKETETGELEIIRSERYMNVLWFYPTPHNAALIDIQGKRLDEGNVRLTNQKSRFIEVITSEGTRYLIDAKSTKRITKPLLTAEFQLQLSNADQVWSKGVIEPMDSWVLLDTNGRRSGSESFYRPFDLSKDHVSLLQNGYWGIYGVQEKRWLLSPEYTCIDEISTTVFRARLQSGKWELHSLNQKKKFGPFESLELLCSAYMGRSDGSSEVSHILFSAKQYRNSFLIDEEGNKISNPTEVKQITTELAYGVFEFDGKVMGSRRMRINQKEPNFKVNTLYFQLYDIIKKLHAPTIGNNLQTGVDERNCRCNNDNGNRTKTELSYAKPNAASVTVSDYVSPRQSWDVGYYEVRNYINVILVKGELKQIELRAIFGYNDELLYDEFKRVITTNETLNLDCSTIENMIELVRNNYKFSDEGLVLIVEQNSRRGRSVNVTIPWQRLAQVPTTKSFAEIFMD